MATLPARAEQQGYGMTVTELGIRFTEIDGYGNGNEDSSA